MTAGRTVGLTVFCAKGGKVQRGRELGDVSEKEPGRDRDLSVEGPGRGGQR